MMIGKIYPLYMYIYICDVYIFFSNIAILDKSILNLREVHWDMVYPSQDANSWQISRFISGSTEPKSILKWQLFGYLWVIIPKNP